MLSGLRKKEVATTLDVLIRHLHVRGWEIDMTKVKGSSAFLGFQQGGARLDTSSKVMNKLLHVAPLL